MEKNGKMAVAWALRLWREQSRLGLSAYAAGAGYFIILSVFPLLILLLGLLRHTGLSVDALTEFLKGIIPRALMPPARRMILSAYRNTSGVVLSLSALVALWSAGRGVSGLIRGLNAVYHRQEHRGWFRVRIVSMLYTGVFLSVILATLILHVFGTALIQTLPADGFLRNFDQLVGLRSLVLLLLQTVLFSLMFMALPYGGNGFWRSVPGALLASVGWLAFSALYSRYVTDFTGYTDVFGPVYVVALTMLWLYVCLYILFLGGMWNHQRK